MRRQDRRGRALSRRVWGFLLCILLFVSLLPVPDASAASLRLYYPDTNKTEIYKGTLVTYNYNDTILSLNGLKGILTDNGVALGPHYELFAEQLGISCTEDSAKNTLTFRRGSNTLVLTTNSKTAVLNGKKVTMNAAPVRVRFSDLNITRIMVPTRFVAESLGYDYKWDSSTATVTIRNRMTLSYNNKVSSYIGTTGKVTLDGTEIDVSDFPTILINNTAMLRAYSVFDQAMGVSCSYNQNTGAIVFSKGALTLRMQENSTTAYLNDVRADCGVAPVNVTYQETGVTALLVPGRFVAESLGYDYTWNSAVKVSEIRTTAMVGVDVSSEASEAENGKPEAPQEITSYSFVVDEAKYLEYENII
ncbi:MAG: copper amine oxidase N-terminal domain-containing protein, partial [Lachnospiraceae bacterium]|nr:copper amine oxidase N-terminal domain-containing protein [Lachnospiraceae bacterium]